MHMLGFGVTYVIDVALQNIYSLESPVYPDG